MPRGVPANGQRRPRQQPAEVVAADEPALAAGPDDDAERQPTPAASEAPTPQAAVSELSPEQLRIQQLETQLAQLAGKKDVEPELEEVANPGDEANIVIHFLEDGFTALGQVWYRGQELEFEPGSQAYRDTCDRRGRSWLSLRDDEFEQVERWGKVIFRNGPWPGKRYVDAAKAQFEKVMNDRGAAVPPPSEAELAAAEKAELRRRRSAPRLSPTV